MLSKSKYTRGINCQKSLWLYVHKKEEQVISESTQSIFARGTNVGELAQQYFLNGKMAVLEEYPGYESAKRTQQFIEQGVDTIYEATFIFDNTLVAVDILHKQNGKWVAIAHGPTSKSLFSTHCTLKSLKMANWNTTLTLPRVTQALTLERL